MPHRYVESNNLIGHTVYEVERVELGVKLGADIVHAPGTHRIWGSPHGRLTEAERPA